MKCRVTVVVMALLALYLTTWILGIPKARKDLPRLLAAELREYVHQRDRPAAEEIRAFNKLLGDGPTVHVNSAFAAFPGIIVVNFDAEYGQRYSPQESRTVFWFGIGTKLLNPRRA